MRSKWPAAKGSPLSRLILAWHGKAAVHLCIIADSTITFWHNEEVEKQEELARDERFISFKAMEKYLRREVPLNKFCQRSDIKYAASVEL
jgi:hypothetical protein